MRPSRGFASGSERPRARGRQSRKQAGDCACNNALSCLRDARCALLRVVVDFSSKLRDKRKEIIDNDNDNSVRRNSFNCHSCHRCFSRISFIFLRPVSLFEK